MGHTAEACDECTQNCVLMHQKDKNPASVATTFFKVVFGDDYSKIMYLPPRFAHSMPDLAGKETQLEDSVGEKWTVKLKQINGFLAFEDGWNKFSLDHGVKLGDILVFHYITGSHFVVIMYGRSGCPEMRHFGFTRHQTKNIGKKGKFIANDPSPSTVNTNGDYYTNKRPSQLERSEIRKKKRIRIDDTPPPSVKTINEPSKETCQRLSPPSNGHIINGRSVSDKRMCQRSDPLVKCKDSGKIVSNKEMGHRSEPLVNHMTLDKIVSDKEPSQRSKPLVKHMTQDKVDSDKEMDRRSTQPAKQTTPVKNFLDTPESVDNHMTPDKTESDKEPGQRSKPLVKHTTPDKFGSDKETGQRSEQSVKQTTPVKTVLETPESVEPFCLFDRDTGNVDEYRRSCFIDLSVFETCPNGSDSGLGNGVQAGYGGDENQSGKGVAAQIEEVVEKLSDSVEMVLETEERPLESVKKLPESVQRPPERMEKRKERAGVTTDSATIRSSIKTRLRNAGPPTLKTGKTKKVPVGTKDKNNTIDLSHAKRANVVKTKPCTSGSRLHNVVFTSGTTAKPVEVVKTETSIGDVVMGLSSVRGSKDAKSKDAKTGRGYHVKKENDILPTVKPEPVDYDDASPLPGSGNTSFSVVMSTYQYLELPKWVKLPSKVILLRNGGDLWPVLFRSELGLKALTYCWEGFARAKGIEPGDQCEFVLESVPNGSLTCSVFRVDVTRK